MYIEPHKYIKRIRIKGKNHSNRMDITEEAILFLSLALYVYIVFIYICFLQSFFVFVFEMALTFSLLYYTSFLYAKANFVLCVKGDKNYET